MDAWMGRREGISTQTHGRYSNHILITTSIARSLPLSIDGRLLSGCMLGQDNLAESARQARARQGKASIDTARSGHLHISWCQPAAAIHVPWAPGGVRVFALYLSASQRLGSDTCTSALVIPRAAPSCACHVHVMA
jgi:hypothetical protein